MKTITRLLVAATIVATVTAACATSMPGSREVTQFQDEGDSVIRDMDGVEVRVYGRSLEQGVRADVLEADPRTPFGEPVDKDGLDIDMPGQGNQSRVNPVAIANIDIYFDDRGKREPLERVRHDGPHAEVRIPQAYVDALVRELPSRGRGNRQLFFEFQRGTLVPEAAAVARGFISEVDRSGGYVTFQVYRWRVDDLMIFSNH